MTHLAVVNVDCSLTRPIRAKNCTSFLCQLRGLTFRRSLSLEEGLALIQKRESRMDSAIHMLFVFMPLGVIWINAAGEVVDTCLALPWRPVYASRRPASIVLEVHPDRLVEFHPGDHVRFDALPLP